jgi:LysR family hydrogen peroxide-inducible transcriptional activator
VRRQDDPAVSELNFSLKQLHYFVVVARNKSLRQAARELGIAQPSLSAQIKALEEALDARLVERSRGGVALTPTGQSLLPEAKVAVGAAEAMREAARLAADGPHGTFRLGVTPSLGPYMLPWVLPQIREAYPGIKFFVREAGTHALVEGLRAGQYDLLLTPLPPPDLVMAPLLREPIRLVLYKNHPLAGFDNIRPSQLAGLEILTLEEHHLFFTQVEELCKRFKARLLRDFEGTSLDAIRQMVYMEMGVALLPALYIRSEIRDRDELRVVRIQGEAMHRTHGLVWRTTSPFRSFYRDLAVFVRRLSATRFGADAVAIKSD